MKNWLSDLLVILLCNFYLLSTILPDLKGALCGLELCYSRVACISAALTVDLQQRQGPGNEELSAGGIKTALNAAISRSVHQHPILSGAEYRESGCNLSSLEVPDV